MIKLILFLILLQLAIKSKKDVIGLYVTSIELTEFCVQLELKEDNTFEYAYWLDEKQKWNIIQGDWYFDKDTVFINSKPKKNVIQSQNRNECIQQNSGNLICTNLDSLKYKGVILKGYSGMSDSIVVFEDTLSFQDSVLISKSLNVTKLRVLSIGTNEGLVWFSNIDSVVNNKFIICDFVVDNMLDKYESVINLKFLLSDGRLYYLSSNNKPQSRYLEKTSIKNKLF